MTKTILLTLAALGMSAVSHADFDPSCKTPDGTWKSNCNALHALTQDARGCTLMASCDGKDSSFTWPLSSGTPIVDYTNGALFNNADEKKSCAA